MVLSDVLSPIRRRWYVLLLGLVLAGGVGWATAVLAPSQYTARGLVMLLPSALSTGPKGNPLLNLGGLDLPARMLVAYYSSEPAQSDLEKLAPKAEVEVTMEESTRGPIIAVDIKDSSPESALKLLHYVADSIPERLALIQAGVGTSKQAAIRSMPLVLDIDADRDTSLMVRLVTASTLAIVALTFFVLFSVDGILLRRAAAKGDRDDSSGAMDTLSATPPHTGSLTASAGPPADADAPPELAAEDSPTSTTDDAESPGPPAGGPPDLHQEEVDLDPGPDASASESPALDAPANEAAARRVLVADDPVDDTSHVDATSALLR